MNNLYLIYLCILSTTRAIPECFLKVRHPLRDRICTVIYFLIFYVYKNFIVTLIKMVFIDSYIYIFVSEMRKNFLTICVVLACSFCSTTAFDPAENELDGPGTHSLNLKLPASELYSECIFDLLILPLILHNKLVLCCLC